MSQVEFAGAIYISNGYIAELENNNRPVNNRIIHLISLSFGVSEVWLRSGRGDMFVKEPDNKLRRMVSLFSELPPKYQDYVVEQIEKLVEITKVDH